MRKLYLIIVGSIVCGVVLLAAGQTLLGILALVATIPTIIAAYLLRKRSSIPPS